MDLMWIYLFLILLIAYISYCYYDAKCKRCEGLCLAQGMCVPS